MRIERRHVERQPETLVALFGQQRILTADAADHHVRARETGASGEIETDEGCLSVPGYYEPVTRAERIHLRALRPDGTEHEADLEGLLAVCVQHECDHLEGKLFVDYLSSLKRTRIRRKLEKQQRLRA